MVKLRLGAQNLYHWLPSRTAEFSGQLPFTSSAGLRPVLRWGQWASSFGVLYTDKCEVLCMPEVLGHAVFLEDAYRCGES